jgi:hypothetical protein
LVQQVEELRRAMTRSFVLPEMQTAKWVLPEMQTAKWVTEGIGRHLVAQSGVVEELRRAMTRSFVLPEMAGTSSETDELLSRLAVQLLLRVPLAFLVGVLAASAYWEMGETPAQARVMVLALLFAWLPIDWAIVKRFPIDPPPPQ